MVVLSFAAGTRTLTHGYALSLNAALPGALPSVAALVRALVAISARNAGGCFRITFSGIHPFRPTSFDTLRRHGWERAGETRRVRRYSCQEELEIVIEDFAIHDRALLRMESLALIEDCDPVPSLLHVWRTGCTCGAIGAH